MGFAANRAHCQKSKQAILAAHLHRDHHLRSRSLSGWHRVAVRLAKNRLQVRHKKYNYFCMPKQATSVLSDCLIEAGKKTVPQASLL